MGKEDNGSKGEAGKGNNLGSSNTEHERESVTVN